MNETEELEKFKIEFTKWVRRNYLGYKKKPGTYKSRFGSMFYDFCKKFGYIYTKMNCKHAFKDELKEIYQSISRSVSKKASFPT